MVEFIQNFFATIGVMIAVAFIVTIEGGSKLTDKVGEVIKLYDGLDRHEQLDLKEILFCLSTVRG